MRPFIARRSNRISGRSLQKMLPAAACFLLALSFACQSATARFPGVRSRSPVSLKLHNDFHDTGILAIPRGGSSDLPFGFGRTAPKPAKNEPFSSSNKQGQQYQYDEKEDVTADEVSAKEVLNAFLSRGSRNKFIARVYATLSAQLLVTGLSVWLFGTQPALRRWTMMGSVGKVVPLASLLVSTVAWAIMCASPDARRKSPNKWWLLGLFTCK